MIINGPTGLEGGCMFNLNLSPKAYTSDDMAMGILRAHGSDAGIQLITTTLVAASHSKHLDYAAFKNYQYWERVLRKYYRLEPKLRKIDSRTLQLIS